MTDAQIIKALECCVKTRTLGDCKNNGCPALTPHGCSYYLGTDDDFEGVIFVELIKDTLNLINRQKAEIERLQNTLDDILDRQPILVERSEKYAKAEAVKEFVERLKAESVYLGIDTDCCICTVIGEWKTWETVGEWCEEAADKIYKEMVGEDK